MCLSACWSDRKCLASRVTHQVISCSTSGYVNVPVHTPWVHVCYAKGWWDSWWAVALRKHPPTLRQLMKETKSARKLPKEWWHISEEEGILYRVVQTNGQDVWQLILPGSLKSKGLRSVHDDLGHQAVEKNTLLVGSRYYWPGMAANVAAYCQKCERCTLAKVGKKLHLTWSSLTASWPLEILAIDFAVLQKNSSLHEIHPSYSHKGSEGNHCSKSASEGMDCVVWCPWEDPQWSRAEFWEQGDSGTVQDLWHH